MKKYKEGLEFIGDEKASILTEIADWNMRIASAKYWRGTILRFYIPKEFTELEMIK